MLDKQLFYLTSDQLHAWQWRRNALSGPDIFPATRAGLDDFMAYLERHGSRPACLLTDLIEEDFTRLLLPHVRGRAGRKLRERRMLQHYRDTPYRTAIVQGRSSEGRRDDQVLFAALTNPLLLTAWTDAMELMQTPLAGIHSCAMLGGDVARRLAPGERHVLLVSRHTAGVRQTYLQGGAVKFSRLVQATPGDDPARSVAAETRKTRQFLASVHLLAPGDLLHVLVLAEAERVETLRRECDSDTETAFRIIDLDDVARKLGVAMVPAPARTASTARIAPHVAEPVLLALLARHGPPSLYPTGPAGNYYRLWHARLSLYASSAVVAIAGLAWTVANLAGYTVAHGNAEGFRSETAHYRANYQRSMSNMPPAVDKTANMRAAVRIDRMVARQGPWPAHMMAMVGTALEQSPQIRLLQLDWRASVPGAGSTPAPGTAAGSPALVAPVSALALGIPRAPAQTLRLEAEVISAPGDYRRVLGDMNAFAQRLAGMPRTAVEIVQLPFDIRPNVKLSGSVGAPVTGQEPNKFVLDVTWTP